MPAVPAFDPAQLPGDVTLDHVIPAQDADTAPLPADLRPELAAALASRGVDRLYSHQAQAYAHVRSGRHLVVVTPTASGKTLCYNLPVLQGLLEEPDSRALYIFPTKALAQDQLAELGRVTARLPLDIRVDVYDGDTPPGQRTAIREGGHIVLTNPDMLHTGILPHHTKWRRLFSSLRHVVLDELHSYRGLFGSQVANVIRRLKRVCEFYGSRPLFVCASATIANPLQLAQHVLEEENVALVDRSGAPRGERRLVFYNPPLLDRRLGIRRSSLLEGRRVAAPWIRRGIQTIVFCRSRLQVEVMLSYLQEDVRRGQDLPAAPTWHGPSSRAAPEYPRFDAQRRVRGYRSGYLPLRRREVEAGLRSGDVWGVVSTNALELGIDIGSLQAAVIVGYPGTIASTWQQLGRAGRRSGSIAVYVASSSPLDQFIVRHPEYFLEGSPEEGLVDPNNLLVLAGHVQAALFELPFLSGERFGRADVSGLLELFGEDGVASHSGGRWYWSHDAFPAEGVSLRRLAADNVVIVDASWPHPEVIGEMDQFTAQVMLHDEAIYLQDGAQYHVDRLDWDQKKAYVRPVEVEYYTNALLGVTVNVLDTFEHEEPGGFDRSHGEVKLTSLATMFKKIRFHTHENIGAGPINLPQQTLHTTAYWTALEPAVWSSFGREQLEAALQGAAHAMRTVAAIRLMCDPGDLGALAEVRSTSTRRPTVTIYEVYPGGVGYARRLYELHDELLTGARQLIRGCPCVDGCPSCIGPLAGVADGEVDGRAGSRPNPWAGPDPNGRADAGSDAPGEPEVPPWRPVVDGRGPSSPWRRGGSTKSCCLRLLSATALPA